MKVALNEQIFEQHQIVESDRSKLPKGVLCRVTYPICNVGVLNKNNRMYEQAVWDKVFANEEIKEKMEKRSLFGQAEHPNDTTQSNLEKTSHVVTKMFLSEDKTKVMQEMDILDTPYGRIVDTLLEAKCLVGVSTRAEGEMEDATDDKGNKYSRVIPEQYEYRTSDFTADPSTKQPYPEKVERDLVTQVQTGIEDEKIDKQFATALLEKMHCSEAKALLESLKKEEVKEEEKEPEKDLGKEGKDEEMGKTEPTTEGTLAFECFDDMVKYLEKAFSEDGEVKKKLTKIVSEATGKDILPEEEYTCRGCGKKVDDPTKLDANRLCSGCTEAIKDVSMEAIDSQMKDIQISEASVRAERDKAFDVIRESEKNLESKDIMRDTEVGILLDKVTKLDEMTQKKTSVLYSILEKRVKEVKSLEESLKRIKENHAHEIGILTNKFMREKTTLESKKDRETISNYAKMKVESSGLTIPKNSQALLEECISVEEVDKVLERVVDALREGALHSQKLKELEVNGPNSPENDRIANSIGKAFEGFFG